MQTCESHVADAGNETEDSDDELSIAEILAKREARMKKKNGPSKAVADDVAETPAETLRGCRTFIRQGSYTRGLSIH